MKCFIHINDEAVAVCKQCGKAMCGNCSAYTNHSGICPECRRTEFIQECNILSLKLKKNKASIAASIAVAAVFAVSAVVLAVIVHVILLALLAGTLAFGIRIICLYNTRKPFNVRIAYLSEEIAKLNVALNRSRSII